MNKTLIIIMLSVCCIFSCRTHKEYVEKTDTVFISKTDTFVKERISYKENTKIQEVTNDHYVVVNTLGDTVYEKDKQYVYVYDGKEQRDSICELQKQLSELREKKNTMKYVEKQLSWWQKFKQDTYIFVLIAMMAMLCTIVIYVIYRIKKP